MTRSAVLRDALSSAGGLAKVSLTSLCCKYWAHSYRVHPCQCIQGVGYLPPTFLTIASSNIAPQQQLAFYADPHPRCAGLECCVGRAKPCTRLLEYRKLVTWPDSGNADPWMPDADCRRLTKMSHCLAHTNSSVATTGLSPSTQKSRVFPPLVFLTRASCSFCSGKRARPKLETQGNRRWRPEDNTRCLSLTFVLPAFLARPL